MINLFKNVSIRYIIALGISGCLITTGNDLSAGRLAGFAACLACIFAQTEGAAGKFYPNMPTLPTPVVFILVIAICAIVGLCNGFVLCYPQEQTQKMAKTLIEAMGPHFENGESVVVNGFGTFEVRKRLERVIINPASGQRMLVPPKLVLGFKPSSVIKDQYKKGGGE